MPDTQKERPSNAGFLFEHALPDGTIVLGDSPDSLGEFVYTPHLSQRNPRYTEVLTVDELKAIMPSAFVAPAVVASPELPPVGSTDESALEEPPPLELE